MEIWGWIFVGLVIVSAIAFGRTLIQRVTVMEWERALVYDRGKFSRTLSAGRYWIMPKRTTLVRLDVRPRFISVPGQTVLTSDAVTLRVSLAAEYEIADPAVAVNEVEDFEMALYLTLQLALREIIGAAEIDDLLEKRDEFGERLLELSREPAKALGLELRRVELKDIMFAGDLKKSFAQVVTARKEGLAALERARGETAALRSLANAARLVEDSPALMQLRILQQLAESSGNTVVIGLPGAATPLPLKPTERIEPPPALPADDE